MFAVGDRVFFRNKHSKAASERPRGILAEVSFVYPKDYRHDYHIVFQTLWADDCPVYASELTPMWYETEEWTCSQ